MTMRIEQLTVRFGDLVALREVVGEAARGRVTAIIGPNAAGKSTLLRACIGAIRPSEGRVLLDHQAVHRIRPRFLASQLAYVPQQSLVGASFTAREVVEIGRYALPADPQRVTWALDATETLALADRPFAHLSMGQQQRITLARALAQSSADGYLLLDEPTSAMDLRHMGAMLRLLRDLARGGAGVLISLHDLDAVAQFADDAWLLDRGRLVASGPVAAVMSLERLRDVFRVEFRSVGAADGPLRLLPELAARSESPC